MIWRLRSLRSFHVERTILSSVVLFDPFGYHVVSASKKALGRLIVLSPFFRTHNRRIQTRRGIDALTFIRAGERAKRGVHFYTQKPTGYDQRIALLHFF